MAGEENNQMMMAIAVILILVLLWTSSTPSMCRGWCRCGCMRDRMSNEDTEHPAESTPQAIDLGAAAPGWSVRTDYMKTKPLSKYVVAEGLDITPPSQRYRAESLLTGRKESLEKARPENDAQSQRFTVETNQNKRNEGDEIAMDSLDSADVTVGPSAWKNDPRDITGYVRGATKVPIGSTDQLRKLLPYMGDQ